MFRRRLPQPFIPIVLLILIGGQALGHPGKTAAIDKFCMAIRHEFVEAAPRYFSGPTPWVELDSLPGTFADTAIASVYSEGPRVTWVVQAMSGPGDGWFETTNYFFDEAGRITKRERYFQHLEANVKIEETTYFEKGKVIKTRFHHATIEPGRENWDAFFDPHCPEYLKYRRPSGFVLCRSVQVPGRCQNPLWFAYRSYRIHSRHRLNPW